MDRLVDRMIRRRLCLAYNTNIEKMRENKIQAYNCECSNYMHVSCVFKGNLKTKSYFQSPFIWCELT